MPPRPPPPPRHGRRTPDPRPTPAATPGAPGPPSALPAPSRPTPRSTRARPRRPSREVATMPRSFSELGQVFAELIEKAGDVGGGQLVEAAADTLELVPQPRRALPVVAQRVLEAARDGVLGRRRFGDAGHRVQLDVQLV